MKQELDPAEQQWLSRLAGEALRDAVTGRPVSAVDREALAAAAPRLLEPAGAFVTVYVDGELRGCLGEVDPAEPLVEVARRCAARAARHDYRFAPVTPDEWPGVTWKISVLTRPVPIQDPAEIVIGRDGLIAEHGVQRGLLLPDVASERGWDVETFLAQLRRKAGIGAEVPWSEIWLERFETQIIEGRP